MDNGLSGTVQKSFQRAAQDGRLSGQVEPRMRHLLGYASRMSLVFAHCSGRVRARTATQALESIHRHAMVKMA